jgi:hypothetical protein
MSPDAGQGPPPREAGGRGTLSPSGDEKKAETIGNVYVLLRQ